MKKMDVVAKATMNLFGGVISERQLSHVEINTNLLEKGIFADPTYDVSEYENFLIQYHKTFYDKVFRSWERTINATDFGLIVDQLLHYITTYGYEAWNIKGDVYYPELDLDELPEIVDKLAFKFVRVYTELEALDLLVSLISQNVAFSDELMWDIIEMVRYLNISFDDLEGNVGNRELWVRLCKWYGRVPSQPVEFLRYLVYVSTGETLLIKSRDLIEKIKGSNVDINEYLDDAPWDLASIFYRYKPLFLAFKNKSNKTFFNRLRKLAYKQHMPMKLRLIDSITSELPYLDAMNNSEVIKWADEAFSGASVYRLVRIYNYLNSRYCATHNGIVYRIRNGKIYAKDSDISKFRKHSDTILSLLSYLQVAISSKVGAYKIYVPDGIHYAVPTSQRQFSGKFPIGTLVELDDGLTVGVSWKDGEDRVDLDLSLITNAGKIGWNGLYRTYGRDVLYSGDVVDARRGATEAIRIEGTDQGFVTVNYYNHYESGKADYTFFVAGNVPLEKNLIVDPNDVVLSTKLTVEKQDTIGFITEAAFVLDNYKGMNRVSDKADHDEYVVGHVQNTLYTRLYLSDIFQRVDSPAEADFDLSPNVVSVNDFLELMREVS